MTIIPLRTLLLSPRRQTGLARMSSAAPSSGKQRASISPGMKVQIVLKQDQRSGKLTEGVVGSLLTNSATHPHGIKVKLTNGQVGRVQRVVGS